MFDLKNEFYLKIILIISFTALIFAYFIEHILGHQPCDLCILERIPYVVAILIILLNYKFFQFEKLFLILLIIVLLKLVSGQGKISQGGY